MGKRDFNFKNYLGRGNSSLAQENNMGEKETDKRNGNCRKGMES